MDLLPWKPEYSLGIPEIDLEHQQMIELINQLHAGLGEPTNAAAVESLLGEVYAAIAAHFALEERLMRDAHYVHFDEHKNDHEALLDQILELTDQVAERSSAAMPELGRRLNDWFTKHFSTHDARLHRKLPGWH